MRKFDSLDFIMQYEGGECTNEAILAGFQELINSGLAWKLQGHYGRMAHHLITEGLCQPRIPNLGGSK